MSSKTNESVQIFKESTALGRLLIKPVSKAVAREMIIANHYSHKWNDGGFGVFNFGIFHADEPDRCLGVAVYGYMKNPRAKTFTHPNPKAWVCELNRMWIDDELGRNAESILIAASIKLLRRLTLIVLLCKVSQTVALVAEQSTKLQTFGILVFIIPFSCAINDQAKLSINRYALIQPQRLLIFAQMLRI